MTNNELMKIFGVTRMTVYRWKKQSNSPLKQKKIGYKHIREEHRFSAKRAGKALGLKPPFTLEEVELIENAIEEPEDRDLILISEKYEIASRGAKELIFTAFLPCCSKAINKEAILDSISDDIVTDVVGSQSKGFINHKDFMIQYAYFYEEIYNKRGKKLKDIMQYREHAKRINDEITLNQYAMAVENIAKSYARRIRRKSA